MKKVFVFIVFAGIIPFSCCPDTKDYIQINSILVLPSINGETLVNQPYVQNKDVFNIRIEVHDLNYIAASSIHWPSNMAFATSCPDNGGLGLKTKIDSIRVFSNYTFNGISAGENLNENFESEYSDGYENGEVIMKTGKVNSLKNYYNNTSYGIGTTKLVLQNRPSDSLTHIFTVQFFVGTKILESSTPIIGFEK